MAELPGLARLGEDLSGRRDLRDSRIFSIDPPNVRDLDDALSIEALPDGTFSVGVHIADVSQFVRSAGPHMTPAIASVPVAVSPVKPLRPTLRQLDGYRHSRARSRAPLGPHQLLMRWSLHLSGSPL